jgi:YidC/Oxa1 family membrane protein insertase
MEKRLLLAVFLSLAILLGYNYLTTKAYHLDKTPQPVLNSQQSTPEKIPAPALPAEIKKESRVANPIHLQYKELESENLNVTFTNLGGNVEEIYLKKYQRRFFETGIFSLQEFAAKPFNLASSQKDRLVYVFEDTQNKISKIYSISNNSIELELVVQNLTSAKQNLNLNLNFFALNLQLDDIDFKKEKSFYDLVISLPDKVLRKSALRLGAKDLVMHQEQLKWLGLKDRYFSSIFKPLPSPSAYYLQLSDNKILTAGIPISVLNLEPHSSQTFKAKLYAGPLQEPVINSVDSDFVQIINFGVFDPVAKGLLSLLRLIHNFIPNWGLCIIALSLLLFFLLYPLTAKSLKSMKAMQILQPEIEKLRQQYKNDPQKLNKEIMELYRNNRVNPFGGCLPMVLQIPIFIALYQALLRSLELRRSHFLWIKDLSEPDRLFTLPNSLPFLGNEFNILPILMAIIMFWQQKISAKTTASANPEQQQLMLILFPILFGVMFYRVPSGLVLYWFVYSGLSLVFQIKQSKVNS